MSRHLRSPARQARERAADQRQARRPPRDDQHRARERRRERVDVDDVEAAERDAVQQHGAHVAVELRPAHQRRHRRGRVAPVLADPSRDHAVEPRARADRAHQQHARAAAAPRSNGPSSKPTTLVMTRAPLGPIGLTARAGSRSRSVVFGNGSAREREVPPLLRVGDEAVLLHHRPQQQRGCAAPPPTSRRRPRARARRSSRTSSPCSGSRRARAAPRSIGSRAAARGRALRAAPPGSA